jgi:chromosome segregation ATPase
MYVKDCHDLKIVDYLKDIYKTREKESKKSLINEINQVNAKTHLLYQELIRIKKIFYILMDEIEILENKQQLLEKQQQILEKFKMKLNKTDAEYDDKLIKFADKNYKIVKELSEIRNKRISLEHQLGGYNTQITRIEQRVQQRALLVTNRKNCYNFHIRKEQSKSLEPLQVPTVLSPCEENEGFEYSPTIITGIGKYLMES